MSAPAVAMLLGLNPTLVTAAVLVTTTLSPLVSPFLADLVAGVQEEIIADFYRRSVGDLPPAVCGFIEEQLVTPSGYRDPAAARTSGLSQPPGRSSDPATC